METEPFDVAGTEQGEELGGVDGLRPMGRVTDRPGSARFAANIPQLSQLCEGQVVAQKYFVDRILGRDGLALVAHVRHVELGRRYLFKYLPPEHCAYPDVVARFLRGARAAQALQSEHTARVLDAGRLEFGSPYAVSEFVSGAPLREVLRARGALSVTDAIDYVLQASEAVVEAHASRLVHKNLSPSRIFLTQRPDGSQLIKVADFGIAEAVRLDPLAAESIRDSLGLGYEASPVSDALQYAAPEQIRNLKDIDGRTDQYALGCILHELLTGSCLYQADSAPSLLAMIAADPATPIRAIRSDVPTGLEAVVLRCIEKERHARFPTLGEFAAALKPYALPEGRSAADRIVRTLGHRSGAMRTRDAMVYVGPAHNPGHAAGSVRPPPEPPPLPSLPPPPPLRRREPSPQLSPWVLGVAGVVAGALLAVLLVKVLPTGQTSPGPSEVDTAQLTLQRELVREIAALRAARERPEPSASASPETKKPLPRARRVSSGARSERAKASDKTRQAVSSEPTERDAVPVPDKGDGDTTRQAQALKSSDTSPADELFTGIR